MAHYVKESRAKETSIPKTGCLEIIKRVNWNLILNPILNTFSINFFTWFIKSYLIKKNIKNWKTFGMTPLFSINYHLNEVKKVHHYYFVSIKSALLFTLSLTHIEDWQKYIYVFVTNKDKSHHKQTLWIKKSV